MTERSELTKTAKEQIEHAQKMNDLMLGLRIEATNAIIGLRRHFAEEKVSWIKDASNYLNADTDDVDQLPNKARIAINAGQIETAQEYLKDWQKRAQTIRTSGEALIRTLAKLQGKSGIEIELPPDPKWPEKERGIETGPAKTATKEKSAKRAVGRKKATYFEEGVSNSDMTFAEEHVIAGNEGVHDLTITLEETVKLFEYKNSGVNDLRITAKNPDTEFSFKGDGVLDVVIVGIRSRGQVRSRCTGVTNIKVVPQISVLE